jgi:hypothetical protein
MTRTNFDAAKRMARVLGTTISRCEQMLSAGNRAGLSTVYMLACVLAYAKPKSRRKAKTILTALVEWEAQQ